ncbi:MAG: hypothetical protein J6A46_00830, partial [Clostridia bacterium]|nr:hypothetical protein [Clostridia bacterium]
SSILQWYHVVYDELSQKIRYDYMIPEEVEVTQQNNVRAVRRDKFGQAYLLFMDTALREVQPGIVNLTDAQRYDDTLVFSTMNSVLFGSDGRMYAFHEGKLKVFGENFELTPVETGMKVALQGIAANSSFTEDGNEIAYQLIDGYLYSMFGEVWTVADDGTLRSYGQLEGVFPRCVEDGYLIGGEIIAIVDTQPSNISYSYNTGRMVQIRFDSTNGKPHATITHIMKANSVIVRNDRMVIEQNERPNSIKRGNTKYFLLSVQDGKTYVDYFAYGYEGGVLGLTKPITEPLILS